MLISCQIIADYYTLLHMIIHYHISNPACFCCRCRCCCGSASAAAAAAAAPYLPTDNRRNRNPRPQLEPQIASLDNCKIN